jgi:sugar/nucleoside kinase (ribokinase family)
MPLLVVGSVAIDAIETPHGAMPAVIGGSATHFAYCASLFSPVRLVGVVGEDFPTEYLTLLRSRPIDLGGLEVRKGRSFRWSGRYAGTMAAAQTLSVELNLFGEFDPVLPAAFRGSRFVFLANGSPHVQRRVLEQVDGAASAGGRFVLLDTMNLWIETEHRALVDLLARVDAVVLNDEELRQLTREPNLIAAGRKVLALGPGVVIVKKGEHGALLFVAGKPDHIFAAPAFPVERVVDPTGAGDTFAAGFMATLALAGASRPDLAVLKRAVCLGIVSASFNVEDFSLYRLTRATREEIVERYRTYLRMLHVDGELPAGAFPGLEAPATAAAAGS